MKKRIGKVLKTSFLISAMLFACVTGVFALEDYARTTLNTELAAINQQTEKSYAEIERIREIKKAQKEELEKITISATTDVYTATEGEDLPDIEEMFVVEGGDNLQYYTEDILIPNYSNVEEYNTEAPKETIISADLANGKEASFTLLVKEKPAPEPVATKTPNTQTSQETYVQPVSGLVYYSQSDGRWKNEWINGSQFGPHGCGPTAIAMILSYYGYPHNPLETAWELHNMGAFAVPGYSGTRADAITWIAPNYGLNVYNAWSGDDIYNGLASGAVADLCIYYYGIPHQVFAFGVDGNGVTTVYDPAGGIYKNDVWSLWNNRTRDDEMFIVSR